MKERTQWHWFVWGKHPGVADFIQAGTQTPLFQSFTKWMDTGFSKVDPQLKKKSRHRSWRFWSKGAGSAVVCGLVRNSCDCYGRSFPLLLMGTGKLADWSINHSLLPFAFESVWKHFEYLAAARHDSVKALSDALQQVKLPQPLWREFQMRIYRAVNLNCHGKIETQLHGGNRLCKIASLASEDLIQELYFCSILVATTESVAPTAVFIGESGAGVAVGMIHDTLKPSDFAWLWSIKG